MYALTMTATTAEKPAELTAMRRATNPVEQLRRAGEAIETATAQIKPRTLRRNAAAVILFRQANAEAMEQGLPPAAWPMQPAAMWRDTIVVSRSLWHKIMEEANPARLSQLRAELDEIMAELRDLPTERANELGRLTRERDKMMRRVARHEAQVRAVEELEAAIAADPAVGRRLLAIAREETAEVRRLELLIPEAMKVRDQTVAELLNGSHGNPPPNSTVAKWARLSTARVAQLRDERIIA